MITPQGALIYTMVLASVADTDMRDSELRLMGDTVRTLPVFRDVDPETLPETTRACLEILTGEEGLDTLIAIIRDSLPVPLRETAYALALDVVAADGKVTPEEARVLEMLRHGLNLDRLVAAGIERGARARWAVG
ncbi:tellurite resistance TerB family protein [Roseospira visakhapatnamensis]|uniref:Tellurite resistance protein n=1 Tax=Roseospira visakhapatnamensis TaxID=390880 RepID=A0A7W6RFN8_9PROT|nr:tellurite resistance TerB family protein [Roseospira visakhapatnamensis]MBB4267166.1 tellurite resistance protein [Roseospira visakhapatnamensis]